jgi:hypothetical protein
MATPGERGPRGEGRGSRPDGNEVSGVTDEAQRPPRTWTREDMEGAQPYPLPEIPADEDQQD